MKQCPCGSGKEFTSCCEPYLSGKKAAPTAEALMRSRYTAYTMANIDYIVETNSPSTRDDLSREETKKWAEESTWKGLEIISTREGLEGDDEGFVEFSAFFDQEDEKYEHHEMSRFVREDGKWFFHSGRIVPRTVVRTEPKIGRNDPCPCGSGKKYKKCCG